MVVVNEENMWGYHPKSGDMVITFDLTVLPKPGQFRFSWAMVSSISHHELSLKTLNHHGQIFRIVKGVLKRL